MESFFFPFVLTEVEITASYFCLRNLFALPQSLTPDEILSAITLCFLWKTRGPDSSARNRVSSSEGIKHGRAYYKYCLRNVTYRTFKKVIRNV